MNRMIARELFEGLKDWGVQYTRRNHCQDYSSGLRIISLIERR